MSKLVVFKSLFATVLGTAALACGALIYFGYQSYTNPSQVYGSWIEINAPEYQTDILTLNARGVFRNNRLISTSFNYDGKNIEIETGKGTTIYALAGTQNSPQLKQIQPGSPIQRFIKQGFEGSLTEENENTELRRSTINGYFDD